MSLDTREELGERIQNIFSAVLQSEECMEKVLCEIEGLAGDYYKDHLKK